MKLQIGKTTLFFKRKLAVLTAVSISSVILSGLFITWFLVDSATRESMKEGELRISESAARILNLLQPMDSSAKSLSGSPWILPALEFPGPQSIARAHSVLDRYAGSFGATVCYLLDARGIVIATSNRNDPDSFLGKSYSFRPYFKSAMEGKAANFFAVGVTTGKKGYYSAHPVRNARGKAIGAVVMKKDLYNLPESYASHFFLLDPEGIIFLQCHAGESMQSIWMLEAGAKNRAARERRYGTESINHIYGKRPLHGSMVGFQGGEYMYLQRPFREEGWSIVLLAPTSRIILYRLIGVIISVLLASLTLFFITVLALRDRSAANTQKSEERYRIAMESTGQLIYDYDIRGGAIHWSGAIEAISGFRPDEINSIYITSREPFIHPDDREASQKLLTAAIRDKTRYHARYRFRRKDGTYFPADDTGDFAGSPGGKPVRMLGSIRDVSEQKILDEENTALQRIADLFLTTDSIERIYREIPRILAAVFGFPVAAMELYDRQSREMVFVGAHGIPAAEKRELRVPDTETISGKVAMTGKAVAETDAGARSDYRNRDLRDLNIKTFICAPIKSSSEALGTLALGDPADRKEAPRVLRALIIAAGQLAMELGRKNAEEFIRESLSEKEVLLREIHHRVKNNMQVIISLLNLQSNNAGDPSTRGSLQDSVRRIRTMAMIHERLYHSQQFTRINFKEYVESLIQELVRSMSGGNVAYRLDIDDVSLALDKAIPCGLLMNELITNSIKHAFPEARQGEITITLRHLDGDAPRNRITVSDNGAGIPEGHLSENGKTLGATLISALVKQLQAEFILSNNNGASFEITFPAD